MIIDTVSNASSHTALGPRMAEGLRFLASTDLAKLEPGRYDILGDECYANVEDYSTRSREVSRWECHRRHIDIQCLVSGCELIGCADATTMNSVEYDPSKDLEFLDGPDGEFVTLEAGSFVILYPQDAHMPGVAIDGPRAVRKVVVKVLA